MKRNFKPMAALAVCALGALAVSSCTKDEFFGLEDSVVIDASTKYEIAMSQEYADFARASFSFSETMMQEVDTTNMKVYTDKDGNQIRYNVGSTQQNVFELLEALKKAYPELEKADKIDFDEIQMIALANNESLSDLAAKVASINTKYGENDYDALRWVRTSNMNYWHLNYYPSSYYVYMDGAYFDAYNSIPAAVHAAIYGMGEIPGVYGAGGLAWGDYTGVAMTSGFGEYWPDVMGYGYPSPEADFIILPTTENMNNVYPGEYFWGGDYFMSGRLHYVYNMEGEFMYYM